MTTETRAMVGIGASIVIIKGVNAQERINDEIENALSPRTGFMRGAS